MEIRLEIKQLFNMANALKNRQVLHTSFGPDTYYVIRKHGNVFNISEYRNKWSFQREGTYQSGWDFKTVEELNIGIFSECTYKWYAINVFTRAIIHFDNWINFVKGFKVKKLTSMNLGNSFNPTSNVMYSYSEVITKTLVV